MTDFRANAMQFELTPRMPAYCPVCGYEDHHGLVCRVCREFFCRSCVSKCRFGDAMETLSVCDTCLPGAVLQLAEAVDALRAFERDPAGWIADELLAGRAAESQG